MPDIIDDQELREREEAASRLAEENDQHFVDYCIETAREARDSRKDILNSMSLLWDAYCNIMQFGEKEDWQSQVVTNKPFTAVERATAIVRRAFKRPEYITAVAVGPEDQDISEEIKKGLLYWFGPRRANVPMKFCNASRMSFAVGISLELIPRWEKGLILDWTEPWKILRDSDALPGEPWSGNFWIHEEWVDKWKLEEGARDKYYINIDQVKEGGPTTTNQESKEELERRKAMFWQRSNYRKAVLVREFNGVVLDSQGSLLLPNAKYTIAGDVLIRKPSVIPFVNIRWPGTSFAPIPHILRYDGRGLIEGVFDLWRMLNNMLSLTMDDFSWVVNRMREIFPEYLLDPTDLDFYPGKDIYRTTDNPDTPVVKDLMTKSEIDKILAVSQHIGQQIDNGDFVTEFVSGLPGSRSLITKGEVQIKTEQNLGIFDSIGDELEGGAGNLGYSLYETLILNWDGDTTPSPTRVLGPTNFARFLEEASIAEKKDFLRENADVKIAGISAQVQKEEKAKLLMALKQYAESERFAPHFKTKELLDETVGALGMYNPTFLKTVEELKQSQTGEQIVEVLGKLAETGGPEVQARIQQFIDSIMEAASPQQGGPPAQQG